jgi:uncharacterized protein (TIGR02099 family)
MNAFFHRLTKIAVYLAATIVILLAIAVGLFRLFLPRLPEYQDDIKEWASAAIGMQVEFSAMDARWGLSGPELTFDDAQLIGVDDGVRIVAAEKVGVGIGFLRLLSDRTLMVDRLRISDTSIDVRQLDDGSYRIQGIATDELLRNFSGGTDRSAAIEIVGEDIELSFMQPGDQQPRLFEIPNAGVSIDENRIAADAEVRLPDDLGRTLNISATQVLSTPAEMRGWDLIVDAEDVKLVGWSKLLPGEQQFASGEGDLELAIALGSDGVNSASAELDVVDVALQRGNQSNNKFDINGRVEMDLADDGWLLAAEDFVITSEDHEWPESSLRFEASVDGDGNIEMFDSRASYLLLDDLPMLAPWLSDEHRELLLSLAPSGSVRNFVATVSELSADEPRFNVSVELDRVGVDTAEGRPGVRGFSGLLRANRAGGRLEINSTDFELVAPDYVPVNMNIDSAAGTIIWRNSENQVTVLSDSILVDSEFFSSQSNLQLVLNNDGSSPEIDLASTWSISDIAKAKRYIPTKGVKPKLYDWFQAALVSGSISRGSTTLSGPLDKFPFDDGEGRLLIEASVRNMMFKYHAAWPAAEQADLEIVIDNARLYSHENRSVNAGNRVVDAEVEIPDLRDPVFSIKSLATGTLATIYTFSDNSPIAKMFGGKLDRVRVSGDASFTLDLTVPLTAARLSEYTFESTIRSNNGTLRVAGLQAPISDLIGEVSISRDHISSVGLGGRFLGEDVSITLNRADDERFSVVAAAEGIISAEGLVDGLGVPLQGFVSGAAPYEVQILFPNTKAESPAPLTIEIVSELEGFAVDLPQPADKKPETSLSVSGNIRFLAGGKVIESSGTVEDLLTWQLGFNKPEGNWDLDRGVVTLGDVTLQPADTRGLHIRGATEVVRFEDWLGLSRAGRRSVGVADRIRSIDVQVDDFYVIGQHLEDHRVKVDRSALDWLVQLEGDHIEGSVFVPYDFNGDRAMVLDMEKLRLPGGEVSTENKADIDPRILPPIYLTAKEFAFGDRNLGAVEANFERTENGLSAATISARDASFDISGSGRWEADDADPNGSRSYISAVLTSTDVKQTMARLGYQPGIDSEELRIAFDLDWSGSPRADIFDVLDGEVEVRFGGGQLEEVEPGAGRVFGLMSISSLPRRLSFDFSDIFKKGFGFDEIAGNFNIDDGNMLTCNLFFEGPAADIGIVGEASLSERTYNQTAVVSANVGNTLPIIGAVVAGPQVAAALLVFSQIFKKPLQEVGQVYYGISGSWDNPDVESTDSDAFLLSNKVAGCLAEGE